MATFLALEDLCNEQSLTPRQTEAVFKASKSLIRKQLQEEQQPKGKKETLNELLLCPFFLDWMIS